ncbi:1,4-dihydroxy-2-naphthoate prenyltransferase [Zhouia amylolytica]|uniref:1,4-dihydroxy-2-naphthoate octaprenyltransferase n=2 Tax=Zhouia amylolytica TaxID=376730 RepID=W2UPV4_9FLAO|nr:1,4-dihydroxy-2-naphthoate octaprenyltransferase [Zhouia amylolytica]ETN95327.1 1,4-dihydroxy-2-naphthoate octaprenyltransferase [Zhouia amylolytica AD3]SFS99993.1 1,4-dihydroxy-2-naphthoate prenyltransferase [Zhouia amylolytica]
MSGKTKAFIAAARLRTLPLSLSGIIVGTGLAAADGYFSWQIFVLALLTTVGFQVLSNFANDYGDGVKGTDANRVGEKRLVASGLITPKQMKSAVILTTVITLVIALMLIYAAFGSEHFFLSFIFFILGIACIVAAIKYTVGKSAYGYSGFGDIFVFIFFGLVSVAGSYFLYAKALDLTIFLPALTIGLLSVGVLNLNNMRDRETDIQTGKNTMVVKIGAEFAKYYHYYLLISAMFFSLIFVVLTYKGPLNLLFIIAFFPLVKHLVTVYKNDEPQELDPELKKLALGTFLFSVLFTLGQIL